MGYDPDITKPSYAVIGLSGAVTNERVLTGTTNKITLNDGGAGGNLTITTGSLVVHTDQSNTYSTGTQNFTGATTVRLQRYTLEGRAQTSGSGTANLSNLSASIQEFNGTFTVNLPAIADMAPGTGTANYFRIKNTGSNIVTVAPNGSEQIDGANSSYTLPAGGSSFIWADGTAWFTLDNSIGILRPANGVIPIGAGTGWRNSTLTAGAGIDITNAAGSVTVASTIKKSTFKRKAADTSRANTTTVTDDPDLLFAVAANETWDFGVTLFPSAGNGTPDFKFTCAGPSGSTVTFAGTDQDNGGSSTTIAATAGGSTITVNVSTAPSVVHFSGTCTNGATPGNLSIQWAQNSSNATATVLNAGSYLQGVVR